MCSTCNNEGTIPFPEQEGWVARCPDCKGASVVPSVSSFIKHDRRKTYIIAWTVAFAAILFFIALGFQP